MLIRTACECDCYGRSLKVRENLIWQSAFKTGVVSSGMQPRMVKSYGVKLATVLDENCTLDSTCCAFADGAVMTPQPPNKTSLDFLVPSSVVAAKCQFLAKVKESLLLS